MTISLNDKQKEIIYSKESRILVNAGPGTGKTHTLIAAAQYTMDTNPNSKIILITFTVAAAEEMKARLKGNPYFIGTIHSFALFELAKLAEKYEFRLRTLSVDQMKTLFLNLLKRMGKEEYADEMFDCFTNRRETEMWKESSKKRVLFNRIEENYIDYKRKNELYDFTDSPLYLLNKLEEYETTLTFDKIYVDEVQDLSQEQYDLIEILQGDKFVIGDPRQSIYGFRGASAQIFNEFKKNYTLKTLDISYRCHQEVLDFVNSDLISSKGYGHLIISELAAEGEVTYLCRTNREAYGLRQNGYNAMTIHQSKGLEFENVVVIAFPLDRENEEENDEERNLFYVACTRTKNRLLVTGKTNLNKVFEKLAKKQK